MIQREKGPYECKAPEGHPPGLRHTSHPQLQHARHHDHAALDKEVRQPVEGRPDADKKRLFLSAQAQHVEAVDGDVMGR